MAAYCEVIDEERSVVLEFLTVQEDSLTPRNPNKVCDSSSSNESDFSEYEAERTSCFTSEKLSKLSFLLDVTSSCGCTKNNIVLCYCHRFNEPCSMLREM